ncbi:hypothetical protein GCM10010440_15670 [Kitasatospora cinereorecta]
MVHQTPAPTAPVTSSAPPATAAAVFVRMAPPSLEAQPVEAIAADPFRPPAASRRGRTARPQDLPCVRTAAAEPDAGAGSG